MRVLVTGGAGYIGSHTCKILKQAGLEPVVYDNLVFGHEWAVQFGPFVEGDVSDKVKLKATIREHKIEAVIHFAAFAYVGESMTNPSKYFQNNCVAMLTLLDALVEEGVRHIIFSSSCATYGLPEEVPISEDQKQMPVNPYGETKLMGEKFLHWYSQAHDLSYVALRYFNASGADPDLMIGEVHDPETHLIPNVMHAALGRRKQVEIFGTDYPTPDGTAVRDYIHVLDLADGHLKALQYLQGGGESTKINLGTGNGHSVKEVIEMVEKVSGMKVPYVESPRRAGDPPSLFANPSKANQDLGWYPQHSSLESICSTAWAWEQKRVRENL